MRFSLLSVFLLSFSVLTSLLAQMTPNAPVKNFKLPRLGDNGYTQWVLMGGKGTYDNAEQVHIEEMGLRVYSGDERMAVEMTMDSPEAIVLVNENKAYSESTIEIVGANFKISGVGWTWDGKTKEIEVLFDTVVQFTQTLSDGLIQESDGPSKDANPSSKEAPAPKTVIHSERLRLITTEKEYQFEFRNRVQAVSGDMDLKSEELIALVDAPEGRKPGEPRVKAGELDSVRKVVARDKVVINQAGRIVRAGQAEFLPREGKVFLSGSPEVQASGAYLSGDKIRSQEGEIVVTGGGQAGRAQMILTQTGGLGIQGGAALSEETIVLADMITMRELEKENQFLFAGDVEVMSGAVQLQSETMTIYTDKSTEAEDTSAVAKQAEAVDADVAAQTEDEKLNVGDVRMMFADGGVRIEQNGQIATSEKVTFYPAEERAILEGDPKVTNGEAIVTGEKMELKPGLATVSGSDAEQVNVTLPEMPDLGYEGFGGAATATTPKPLEPKEEEDEEETDTVVQSNMLRMIEEADQTIFRFTGNVSVLANNLDARCERLDVFAKQKASKDLETGSVKERLEVQRIEAIDDVVVKQDSRVATADIAFILPDEGKVILEGDAEVEDERGTVSGHRMILIKGQRAVVEGGGPEEKRAKITLPEWPGGKF